MNSNKLIAKDDISDEELLFSDDEDLLDDSGDDLEFVDEELDIPEIIGDENIISDDLESEDDPVEINLDDLEYVDDDISDNEIDEVVVEDTEDPQSDVDLFFSVIENLDNSQGKPVEEVIENIAGGVSSSLDKRNLKSASNIVIDNLIDVVSKPDGFKNRLFSIKNATKKLDISEVVFRKGSGVYLNEHGTPIRGGVNTSNYKEGDMVVIYPPKLSKPEYIGKESFLDDSDLDCLNNSLASSKSRIVEGSGKPIYAFVASKSKSGIDLAFFNGLASALSRGQEVDSKYLALLFNNSKIQIVKNIPTYYFKPSTIHTFKNGKISSGVSKVLFKNASSVKVRGLIMLDIDKFSELTKYQRI